MTEEGAGRPEGGAERPVRPEDDGPTTKTKIQGSLAVIPDSVYRESSSLACSAVGNDNRLWIPAKNCGNDRRGSGKAKRGAGRPKGGGNSLVPRHRALIGAPDAILPPARVAPKLVRLHSILRRRDIGTLHVSPASRPRTRDGFTLQGFDKRLRSRHRSPLPRVGQPFPRPLLKFYEN